MDPVYNQLYKDCFDQSSTMYVANRSTVGQHGTPMHHSHHLLGVPHVKIQPQERDQYSGFDNDALDFIEGCWIENEVEANGSYFGDPLASGETKVNGDHDRIISGSLPFREATAVSNGDAPSQATGYPSAVSHNLPDSPPDSGSEPPYSPSDPGSRSPNHKGHPSSHGLLRTIYHRENSAVTTNMLPNLTDLQPIASDISIHTPSLISVTPTASANIPSSENFTFTRLDDPAMEVDGATNILPVSGDATMFPFLTTASSQIHQPPQDGRGQKRKFTETANNPAVTNTDALASSSISSTSNEDSHDATSNLSKLDPCYRSIKFARFKEDPSTWYNLSDERQKDLTKPYFKVDADKGFNFSHADDAFVCQKKNHFQITCHVNLNGSFKFVKTPSGLVQVEKFYVHFFGVKTESPDQRIKIEQSQSDRSKRPFNPQELPLNSKNEAKITVGRLHFSETTSNNMRKKGKPNPDQKHFYLIVALHAHCADGDFRIIALKSEPIIVRASNPGQFESDMELSWQKGHSGESIYHMGCVGINTEKPSEALVVYGNCSVTGKIVNPSDMRAKEDVTEIDSKQQLKNVQQLRVVKYKYNPEFARLVGLSEEDAVDTGVIAQEVQKVMPDAVKETGDIELPNGGKINKFLVVNKERIFMENVGAVKELCKVTGKLEDRIDHLEKITSARTVRTPSLRSSTRSRKTSDPKSDSRKESSLCSNKCIQLLIVSLVVLMAFCLVAMATLYILEFQKRSSYDPRRHNSNVLYNVSHEHNSIPNVDFRHVGYGYDNPSTFSSSLHPMSTNNTYDKHSKSSFKSSSSSFVKSALGETHSVYPKPKVLGKPQYCIPSLPYLDTHCLTYCCAGSSFSGTVVDMDIERKNQVSGNTVGNSAKILSSLPTSSPPKNISDDSISSFTNNPVHRNGLDSRRKRRQADEKEKLISVPSITIMSQNINHTLDSSYCMVNTKGYHDCVSKENRYFSSANLTYHIPLSKFWDELDVSVVFRFNTRVNMSNPHICEEFYDNFYCRLDEAIKLKDKRTITAQQSSSHNKFSVSLKVGGSRYTRFNIKFSPNPTDYEKLCDLQKNIFEFNFHFYRVCHE